MIKQQFINSIAEKSGLTKKDTAIFLEAYQNVVIETLMAGENIKLVNFGSYEIKDVAEKIGRNPKSGEEIAIPKHKKMVFKFSKVIRNQF